MANKQKGERYEQLHITVPVEDLERWRAFKEVKYNGLNAMSMMIRNFVNDGIDREEFVEKGLEKLTKKIKKR